MTRPRLAAPGRKAASMLFAYQWDDPAKHVRFEREKPRPSRRGPPDYMTIIKARRRIKALMKKVMAK